VADLPEWIEDLASDDTWDEYDRTRVMTALRVAWKALERLNQVCACGDNGAVCDGCIIGNALYQISTSEK
jgi:hypothetical protein